MAKSTAARVHKRSKSPRLTRSRSSGVRMSAASAASGSGSGGVLERMVEEVGGKGAEEEEEAEGEGMDVESDGGVALGGAGGVEETGMESQRDVEGETGYEGKGKTKVAAVPDKGNEGEEEVNEDKPFRLFDLPTEIRLEIYRACLTRPYKILLSKAEKPAPQMELMGKEEEVGREQAGLRPNRVQSTVGTLARHPIQFGSARRVGAGRGSARATLRASSSLSGSTASIGPTTVVIGDTRGRRVTKAAPSRSPPIKDDDSTLDPLIVPLLRTSKTVDKEARDVLYAENVFTLDIFTAVPTLAALHQRSRRRIKYIELEIPTYTEILESFSETVRLSLRYCFGLRKLVIHTPFTLPGGEGNNGGGNTTVYANGFDILRWLPQGCEVVVEGMRNREIDVVVGRHMQLAGVQDKAAWQRMILLSLRRRFEGTVLVGTTELG